MSAAHEPIRADARYDRIGRTYSRSRKPDPRIAARIAAAVGTARTIVNVGSDTGSYEPRGRRVVAVEPSVTMIAQRPPDAAPVVRAVAERLPFRDRAFDAALALFTIHHWQEVARGSTSSSAWHPCTCSSPGTRMFIASIGRSPSTCRRSPRRSATCPRWRRSAGGSLAARCRRSRFHGTAPTDSARPIGAVRRCISTRVRARRFRPSRNSTRRSSSRRWIVCDPI